MAADGVNRTLAHSPDQNSPQSEVAAVVFVMNIVATYIVVLLVVGIHRFAQGLGWRPVMVTAPEMSTTVRMDGGEGTGNGGRPRESCAGARL